MTLFDNLHLNNAGHLSYFHVVLNNGDNKNTIAIANKEAHSIIFGTKVNGAVPSVHSIKHCTRDRWFLIHSQPQWLNLTNQPSSGTSTGREVIPMFPHLKIPPFILCWIQLGLCFVGIWTSAFHIDAVVMGNGGRVCFGPVPWGSCEIST